MKQFFKGGLIHRLSHTVLFFPIVMDYGDLNVRIIANRRVEHTFLRFWEYSTSILTKIPHTDISTNRFLVILGICAANPKFNGV